MKTGKYTLREFFSNTDLNNIIIPEIQRDYVWGKPQVEKLLDSIVNDYGKYKEAKPINNINDVDPEIVDSFNDYYKKNYLSSNIGFIYAYSDSDYPGSYFLIDGQQRFSTLYLVLLILSTNGNDELLSKFKRIFTNNELIPKPKLDYRVREASHNFLCNLIQSIDKVDNEFSSSWIKDQSWYLRDYDNDTTIRSIIANIDVITNFLKAKRFIIKNETACFVDPSFLDYLENYLEFWYFDTNISEQGEELYVYMNARGETMQDYENLKADLIGKLTDSKSKIDFGTKWEQWQDFFWMNRGNNVNADKGFNEFLCCISGLEHYLKRPGKSTFIYDFSRITYEKKKENLSMEIIESYYQGLNHLFSEERIASFSKNYQYSDWISKAKNLFIDIFNESQTNWFANPKDDNKTTERNRMVFVWSMLYYMRRIDMEDVPVDDIYRTFRLFYVRFKNNDRTVDKSIENIETIIRNGPWHDSILKGEEKNKYTYIMKNGKESESWIWKIEDHPLNIDGSDVGGINSSHLINFEENPNPEVLEKTYNAFCSLFEPTSKPYSSHKKMLNNLLYVSLFDCNGQIFWDIDGPSYYTRLNFDSLKKIIRGKCNTKDNEVFKSYLHKYLIPQMPIKVSLNDVEIKMETSGIQKDDIGYGTIIWALCWYAAKYGEKIWDKGLYMVFQHQYEDVFDENFPNITALTNMKGDFRGQYGFQYLQEL